MKDPTKISVNLSQLIADETDVDDYGFTQNELK